MPDVLEPHFRNGQNEMGLLPLKASYASRKREVIFQLILLWCLPYNIGSSVREANNCMFRNGSLKKKIDVMIST